MSNYSRILIVSCVNCVQLEDRRTDDVIFVSVIYV